MLRVSCLIILSLSTTQFPVKEKEGKQDCYLPFTEGHPYKNTLGVASDLEITGSSGIKYHSPRPFFISLYGKNECGEVMYLPHKAAVLNQYDMESSLY